MSYTKIFFIQVLSDFINKKQTESLTNIDWNEVMTLAKKHQVGGIIYYQCKNFIDDQVVKSNMLKMFGYSLFYVQKMKNNYEEVKSKLKCRDIQFVLVKGFEIAKLYPEPALRTMGDIDLLVHGKDFQFVADVFLELGFHYGKKTPHEITFKKNNIYYEIHEFMIDKPADADELRKSFYNDYWDYLVADSCYGEQRLDWSFHFMYLLQHMRQHILWEGIGFRQFMDMAIIIRNISDLDWKFIVESAKKVEMYDFLQMVLALVEKWFDVKALIDVLPLSNELYTYVTDKTFAGGVFGFCDEENKISTFENEYRESNRSLISMKILNISRILFPSYSSMVKSEHYSFLKGHPCLLPCAWIYRCFYSWKHKNFEQVKKLKRIVKVNKRALDKRRSDIEMWKL